MIYRFLRRLERIFLHSYMGGDIIVYQKSRILLYMQMLILSVGVPLTFFHMRYIDSTVGMFIVLPLCVIVMVSMAVLRSGRFIIAANGMMIMINLLIWASLFTAVAMSIPPLRLFPSLVFIPIFISIVPLVVLRRVSAVLGYYAFNMVVCIMFYRYFFHRYSISLIGGTSYGISMLMGLVLISLISFLVFVLYTFMIKSFYRAREEIQAKNENLIRTNREYEIVNTELTESRTELALREEQYRSLYDNAPVGMITIQEPDGQILKSNETARRILGIPGDLSMDMVVFLGDYYDDIWDRERLMADLLVTGRIVARELRFRRPDGVKVWIEVTAQYMPEKKLTEAVFTDISSLKKTEQSLYRLTYYDTLTELPNRNHFMQRVQSEINRSRRKTTTDATFCVMCAGIDRFKDFNEMHGKATGDQLLRRLATRLAEKVRDNDAVARMEGDKFLVLLTDTSGSDSVAAIVRRTMDLFTGAFIVEDREYFISGSMGFALYPADADNPSDLISRAETALYQAKEKGGNTYHMYDNALNAALVENLRLQRDLRRAIRDNHFRVFLQPRVDAAGNILGMEALVRWDCPTRGLVQPSRFIPLAEKNGMIIDIGRIVLSQSLTMMRGWLDRGYPGRCISVNISPRQFIQPDLVDMIAGILEDTGVPPSLLELEITESGIMVDEEDSIRKLEALHRMGVSLSIDDFGTGYSSLNKLRDYPIDVLKIDQTFVREIPGDERSETIVRAIIDLARNLGFSVVAEGIETILQRDFLSLCGCSQFQGYYFSKPLPSDEFDELLRRGGTVRVPSSI